MRSFVQLLLGVWLSSLPWTAHACKCAGPPKAFEGADVVLQATIVKQLNQTSRILYLTKIVRAWKGCGNFTGTDTVTITTASESAACGVPFLKPKTTYFLSGNFDVPTKTVSINSCGFQAAWNTLTASQLNRVVELSKKYAQCSTCQKQADCLKGQYCSAGTCRAFGTCAKNIDCLNPQNEYISNCAGTPQCKNSKCPNECSPPCPNGVPLVQCFADPCTVTRCSVPNALCTANYCGGCNAVFFNASGYQVCSAST